MPLDPQKKKKFLHDLTMKMARLKEINPHAHDRIPPLQVCGCTTGSSFTKLLPNSDTVSAIKALPWRKHKLLFLHFSENLNGYSLSWPISNVSQLIWRQTYFLNPFYRAPGIRIALTCICNASWAWVNDETLTIIGAQYELPDFFSVWANHHTGGKGREIFITSKAFLPFHPP